MIDYKYLNGNSFKSHLSVCFQFHFLNPISVISDHSPMLFQWLSSWNSPTSSNLDSFCNASRVVSHIDKPYGRFSVDTLHTFCFYIHRRRNILARLPIFYLKIYIFEVSEIYFEGRIYKVSKSLSV